MKVVQVEGGIRGRGIGGSIPSPTFEYNDVYISGFTFMTKLYSGKHRPSKVGLGANLIYTTFSSILAPLYFFVATVQ